MSQPIFDQRQGGFRVFVGNLGSRTNITDLQHECERYGPLVDCWVARNPPGFAFILYKYGEDAESAVRNMDGRMICGQRVRVEHAKARSVNSRNAPTYGGSYRERERSRHRSRSRSSSRERSKKKSSHRRDRSSSSSSSSSSSESTSRRKDKNRSSDDSSSDRDKKRSRHRRKKSNDDNTKETKPDGNESEHSSSD